MFFLDKAKVINIDGDLIKIILIFLGLFLLYFFSYQLQLGITSATKKFGKTVGVYSTSKEFELQKYVYQHNNGWVAKLYKWVNNQLIALGLKRNGVSVFGYLLFWAFIAAIGAIAMDAVLKLGATFLIPLWIMIFIISLVMTRVVVSERMTRREAEVMNAVDLIIPEIGNGVKNAIVMYQDKFSEAVREDFQVFISNIQDRGYSFKDAMYILDDNLGYVFHDFAQKAIYFEESGEREMLEIFSDITETNRLRRTLRAENASAFASLTATFIVSTLIVVAYFIFIIITDEFSRKFFLTYTAGKVLLLVMMGIVFAVLSYISTIKSKDI